MRLLNLCFLRTRLDFFSHSENHTLARPQPSLDAEASASVWKEGKDDVIASC